MGHYAWCELLLSSYLLLVLIYFDRTSTFVGVFLNFGLIHLYQDSALVLIGIIIIITVFFNSCLCGAR